MFYRTLENPALPESDLGYQAENLELVTHAVRRPDPWAGWAGSDSDPRVPWIFWYQAGPAEAVRGCLVDAALILRQLRTEITGNELARLELVPAGRGTAAAGTAIPGLPGWRLLAEPGELFQRKESDARLTALLAAGLFGLFLVGGTALAVYTRRAARDAERKLTFVAQVSHELRTPLTSIRMFGDMLAEPAVAEAKRVKYARNISAESSRLQGLIERLLAFNSLEQGTRQIVPFPIDVAAVVRETAEQMGATLQGAGLAADVVLVDGPALALGDASILKQALLNLLDNACKYAGAGESVQLTVTQDTADIFVRVADAGPGVPPAVRDRLFEPFVQGGQTLTAKSPGVGLGLSIARGMLRQAGADLVLVESAQGAVFEIRLPKPPG